MSSLLSVFSPNHAYHHHFSHEFLIFFACVLWLWLLQHDTYAGEWVKLNIIILILSLHFIQKKPTNFATCAVVDSNKKTCKKYGPCHIPKLPFIFFRCSFSLIHYHPLSVTLVQCVINFQLCSFCVLSTILYNFQLEWKKSELPS